MNNRPAGLRVAMALYADVTHDSRVLREAETLCRAGHTVTIYCLAGTPPPDSPFRVVARVPDRSSILPDGSSPFLSTARLSSNKRLANRIRWILGYMRNIRAWGRWAVAGAGEIDVWHAHDLTGLIAVGPLVRRPARFVYDSHEIFLETGSAARLPAPLRRILSTYEGLMARRAFALMTVNEGYAEFLGERLRPKRTVIVRNCPPRWTPPTPPSSRLRDAAKVPALNPLVLYHGVFARSRGIEQLADAILEPGLESTHVALLGFGPNRQEFELRARDPRYRGRLHLLEAVLPGELLEWVAGADAAVSLLQPTRRDHALSTPNKLWESLAAGVPVVGSDFSVIRRIVLDDPEGSLGAVCDPTDPASIAAAIRAVVGRPPDERAAVRARCLRVAHERWNWERESIALVGLYAALLATV